ncbi:ABC transporter ATP-binding protein [Acuticoccus mangrovi]|uniref:ABC transporter ATP-binding protein n=1 Tax=Acuticoccus mangrovi TaxID=2796142 RepID=A0A934INW5_9HYPH|nr:ABC transporter ATP-binding protein [Acuticoccus mangrovi]
MLEVERLEAGYGASRVLFDVTFQVASGEVVSLLGRNGMGKTTTVHSIFGMVSPRGGRIAFAGAELSGRKPFQIASLGLGLVPEGRRVFRSLTVVENLTATARAAASEARSPWTTDAVFALFPRLKERTRHMGSQLSGGEQQMLAIGRALMTNPQLLVLDEATEGLAPVIRQEIWACLTRLKGEGLAILIVDQNLEALTRLADRHVIVEKGRTVWSGDNQSFINMPELRTRHLSV